MRTIQTPDGRHWVVRRKWLPNLDQIRNEAQGLGPRLTAAGAALLLLWFIQPALMLFVIPTLLFYSLFNRNWQVEAKTSGRKNPQRQQWTVKGWQQSGDFIDYAADQLESGYSNIKPSDLPFS